MELVLYFIVILIISVGSFWICGCIYGLFRSPKIYFPMMLATKMSITAVLGGFLFMVGGVILSTVIFNHAMKKRSDYSFWPTMISGALISIVCSVVIYYSIIIFAFKILD